MALAENIKARRKALKLSQEYVAEQLDVSRQAVSKWESGKSEPTAANLVKLAALFEMSVAELTAENEVPAHAETSDAQAQLHNAKMQVSRFFGYMLTLAGIQGYFGYWPNDLPRIYWGLVFLAGCFAIWVTSCDMFKRRPLAREQLLLGAGFFASVLFLPRWLPFGAGGNWLVSSLLAAVCVIMLNLCYWRHIWPR